MKYLLSFQEILETVQILQSEMEREQKTFNKLNSLIADLSPNRIGSTEFVALSNQMMASQERLAMLMGRNMKCFSQVKNHSRLSLLNVFS